MIISSLFLKPSLSYFLRVGFYMFVCVFCIIICVWEHVHVQVVIGSSLLLYVSQASDLCC